MILDDGFFADERLVGLNIGRRDEFDWADEIAVAIADQGKVRLVENNPVFLEVMEAGDFAKDVAFDLPHHANYEKGFSFRLVIYPATGAAPQGGGVLEETHDGLSGEAVSVVAAGRDLAPPAQAVDLVFRKRDGLPKHILPNLR
jgi:hypothetical protein